MFTISPAAKYTESSEDTTHDDHTTSSSSSFSRNSEYSKFTQPETYYISDSTNRPSTPNFQIETQYNRPPSISLSTPSGYNDLYGISSSSPRTPDSQRLDRLTTDNTVHTTNLNRTVSAPAAAIAPNILALQDNQVQRSSSLSLQLSASGTDDVVPSIPELIPESEMKMNSSDWAEHYNITPEIMAEYDPNVIKLQYEIHNFIDTENNYVRNTRVFLEVFKDGLPKTLLDGGDMFKQDAFDTLEKIYETSKTKLLEPLLEDQKNQGPFLTFNCDAVYEWVLAIKDPVLHYAARHPYSVEVVNAQKINNLRFKNFINEGSRKTITKVKKDFESLFENTRTRFGQYHLLFEKIQERISKIDANDPQVATLQKCIDESKGILKQYNEIQGRIGTQLQLRNLEKSLLPSSTDLMDGVYLNDEEREILHEGMVEVKESDAILSYETTKMILLDHFLIMGHPKGDKLEIEHKPIHLELLVIESVQDDPTFKGLVSKFTRGTGSVRQTSVGSSPALASNSSTGMSSPAASTSEYYTNITIAQNNNLIYLIKIRDMSTYQSYYIYVKSEIERKEWVKRISHAKESYSKKARESKYDPLSIKVIDSNSFGRLESTKPPKKYLFLGESPLFRAFAEYKNITSTSPGHLKTSQSDVVVKSASSTASTTASKRMSLSPGSSAVSRFNSTNTLPPSRQGYKSASYISCAADVFYGDIRILLLGLNGTLFACQIQPNGLPLHWIKISEFLKVKKIQALMDKNMLFILTEEKMLCYYKLNEVIMNVLSQGSVHTATHVKISKPTIVNQNVESFESGKLGDKYYLFFSVYSNRSTITIFEVKPEDEKGKMSKKFSFKSKHSGLDFKTFDELFTPTRNKGFTIFNSTFCVHTESSFEVMRVNNPHPRTLPEPSSIQAIGRLQNLPEEEISSLKRRILETKDFKTIIIDRVKPTDIGIPTEYSSRNDFILVYNKFALICDDQSRLRTAKKIDFLQKITDAHVWYPYLITFSDRLIEIRMLTQKPDVHRLVQVVTGTEIRMLGFNKERETLVFAMLHPENSSRQVILEFIRNKHVDTEQERNTLGYL